MVKSPPKSELRADFRFVTDTSSLAVPAIVRVPAEALLSE